MQSIGACDGQILAVGDEAKRITLLRTDIGNSIDYRMYLISIFYGIVLIGSIEDYHVSFPAHTNAVLTLKWSNDDTTLVRSNGGILSLSAANYFLFIS